MERNYDQLLGEARLKIDKMVFFFLNNSKPHHYAGARIRGEQCICFPFRWVTPPLPWDLRERIHQLPGGLVVQGARREGYTPGFCALPTAKAPQAETSTT